MVENISIHWGSHILALQDLGYLSIVTLGNTREMCGP
jgi:hypothetical protein